MWDGKYKDGKKVGPVRIELPFQTVETVNETAQQRQLTLDMFFAGRETEWRNRLIWGDKKYVLPSLLPEFAGKINLIYVDPPFATGADFSFNTVIPESDNSFIKEPSIIEQKAYRDTWGRGLDSYLQWFYETVVLLRELLSEDGSIYVHCDWRVRSAVRLILDEVFGSERHSNEIIWHYQSGGRQENRYSRKHDTIYFYNRSDRWIFNSDDIGEVRGTVKRNNMKREIDEDGRIYFSIRSAGKIYKYHEDEKLTTSAVWTEISHIQQKDPQRVGYPTQKPEALLERIIRASSNEGDLFLDCFCGSGTTVAVAEKLGRQWIACDLGRFAIHTTRKRLLSIDNVKPFVVQNLGKYERQVWQVAEFGESAEAATAAYRRFVLDLYR